MGVGVGAAAPPANSPSPLYEPSHKQVPAMINIIIVKITLKEVLENQHNFYTL